MKRVLKWTVKVNDDSTPIGPGEVVHIENQSGRPEEVQIWTVELGFGDTPTSSRWVQVVGTGHPIPDDWKVLGSCVVGPFVWHVVERP